MHAACLAHQSTIRVAVASLPDARLKLVEQRSQARVYPEIVQHALDSGHLVPTHLARALRHLGVLIPLGQAAEGLHIFDLLHQPHQFGNARIPGAKFKRCLLLNQHTKPLSAI